ncbi:hypothetical protein ACHAP8_007402 [Fusarium lateritium]
MLSTSFRRRERKLLVVSLDGTLAGSFRSSQETVISVLPKLICKRRNNVVSIGFHGVGSDISPSDRFLGGLCGWGTQRNVITAYKRIAEEYEPGDKIILSGYSRGAWAARYLALIISVVGLPEQGGDNEFFHLLYKECDKNPNFDLPVTRKLLTYDCYTNVTIEALCCFDTVGSLGLPLFGIAKPLALLRRGQRKEDMVSSVARNVKHAFHCLALHETREPFFPTYMSGRNVHQVFFVGNHGHLGWIGSQESFVHAALAWMIQQLHSHTGIDFDDDMLKRYFQSYRCNGVKDPNSRHPWLTDRIVPRSAVGLALMGEKARKPWKVPYTSADVQVHIGARLFNGSDPVPGYTLKLPTEGRHYWERQGFTQQPQQGRRFYQQEGESSTTERGSIENSVRFRTANGQGDSTHRIYEAPVGRLEAKLLGLPYQGHWWGRLGARSSSGNLLFVS